MIEIPLISLGMIQGIIQNFTIIATLVLLYYFIPDTLLSRSKVIYAIAVGAVFGLAAAMSIPALWQTAGALGLGLTAGAPGLGLNVILIPLAGFVGGPVSAAITAVVILLGSVLSNGTFQIQDTLTVMAAILLGALFYEGKSWKRFPRSTLVQLLLLGTGMALIELFSSGITSIFQAPQGPLSSLDMLLVQLPFLIFACGGTVLIGAIIRFIDRKRQAERELLDYRDHLEGLVEERAGELRQANSLQNATIESTADGIIVTDRNGVIRAYNRKAARILDLPHQIPGDPLENLVYVDHIVASLIDPDQFIPLVAALPPSAEQIVTTPLKFSSGRIYELYVHPQQIGDQIVGRVWSLHDITEQQLAEEAIRSANNKLNLLSNITRHDIFNQLTALGTYLELVQMENRDPSASGHLDAMKKSLEVIRLQLEFTRDYQDLGLKKPGWQNLDAAFSNAAKSFEDRNLAFHSDTGPVEIFADPMIGQVFYNLIDNTLRHGERVSRIRLSLQAGDPDLIVVYEDDGVGVPPGEKDKIFLKGFGKHTGLGMFLIMEILAITGITIRENGTWQQGVRFEIRVPSGKFRFP
jgi:signal transduction histidine kinase